MHRRHRPGPLRTLGCALGPVTIVFVLLVPSLPGVAAASHPGAPRAAPLAPPLPPEHARPVGVARSTNGSGLFGNWPDEGYDGQRTNYNPNERTLAPSNISHLERIWSVGLPKPILSSPIEVNGTVYVGDTDGALYALAAGNGSLEWRTPLGGSADYTNCRGLGGIADTPAYWNGTIFVGGGSPSLYAVNASNGSILWSVDIANDSSGNWAAHYNWASPLVYNDTVYVGVASGCDTPLVAGQLLAINLNGSTHAITRAFWVTSASESGGGVWRAPSVDPATNTVYITTGNENASCTCAGSEKYTRALVALNATTLKLQGYWQDGSVGCDCDSGTSALVTPPSKGHSWIYEMNKDGKGYVFNSSGLNPSGSGALEWFDSISAGYRARAGGSFNGSTLFMGGGAATFGSTSCAGTIDSLPLSLLNYYTPLGWVYCAPNDEQAALAGANGLLYSFAVNTPTWTYDQFQVVSAANGTVLYSTLVNQSVFSGAAVADGRVFFDTMNGSTFSGTGYVDAYGLPLSAQIGANAPGPGGALVFNGTGAGGAPPYSCRWEFGGGVFGTGCRPAHVFAVGGSYQVNLTVTDVYGEVATQSEVVSIAPSPLYLAQFSASPPSVDIGVGATLDVLALAGVPPYSYSYTGLPTGCQSADVPSLDCRASTIGRFFITVVVSDTTGTAINASLLLDVHLGPVVQSVLANPPTVVLGGTTVLTVLATGGASPYHFAYAGLPPGCGSINLTELACAPSETGSYSVQVTVVDSQGLWAQGSAAILVLAPPLGPPFELVSFLALPSLVYPGQPATLVATVTGGSPPYDFVYSSLPANCSAADSPTVVCPDPEVGYYTVSLRVSDSGWNSTSASASFDVVSLPASSSSMHPSAPGSATGDGVWVAVGVIAGAVTGAAVTAFWLRYTGRMLRPKR